MSETAVVLKTTSAIAAYGDREDVREITDRLMHLHPAAKEVGAPAMRAVAQLALMRGANPLPTAGEIYVWQDRGKTVMDIGIAYYRRIASKKDRVLWEIEPRLMTDEERDRYHIAEGDIGAICKGALLSQAKELMDLGVSLREAREASARTSTAIVEYSDQFYTKDSKYGKKAGDPRQAPHGRTWEWVAEKRAEKAFYKMMSLVDDTLTERIDAVNEVREQVGQAYHLYEERQNYTLDDGNRDFFGIEPAGPEWDGLEEHDMVIIDAEPDEEEVPWEDEEEPAGVEDRPEVPDFTTWAEFSKAFADGHPYYRNQHHVFGNVKKIFGGKVVPFADADIDDVIQQLEAHANAEADQALDEEE